MLVCQSNVGTEMPEEKCKGSFRTLNSLKEAQDGSLSEDEGKILECGRKGSHVEETKMMQM